MSETKDILNEILHARGIVSQEEKEEFLSEKPRKTYDPFLLLNMEAGVDLILSEIENNTRICIYGDYDADGVTSICILTHVLKHLTKNITYYVPSRFNEGYGLNKTAIKKLKEDGVGLIITVDCGSVSYDEVEYAKSIGMKVIVTDHHSIDENKSDCILINPKQPECGYPFKELAGCGVAFKMAQAIQKKTGLHKRVISEVLDLVAVGTVGDVVSLRDENRTIVKYGLKSINMGTRKAMKSLIEAISINYVESENIAFGIAPHINAAGRMASASDAIELFISHDDISISEGVEKLIEYNKNRKAEQEKAFTECMEMIREDDFIVIHSKNMHEGIAGIVAGKIKEAVNRPVIIVTSIDDNTLKGTGRSIEGVNLYKLLKKNENLFEKFGGHSSACGFTMHASNLKSLKENLQLEMVKLIEENPNLFTVKHEWDMVVKPDAVTVELAEALKLIEPIGQDNPKPCFLIKNVVAESVYFMGNDKTHVKFSICTATSGDRIECVLFQRAQEFKDILLASEPIDLLGYVESQTWRGNKKVQFVIKEIL